MWESNPRITGPQSAVLTTSPIPPCQFEFVINININKSNQKKENIKNYGKKPSETIVPNQNRR